MGCFTPPQCRDLTAVIVFVVSLIFLFCQWSSHGASVDVISACRRFRKLRPLPAKNLTSGDLG